jgi:uncharacterized sulfatase
MPSRIAAFACLLFGLSSVQAFERPNVLLIIVDDLRTELGCYGRPEVHTPNIDRLAAQGVRFDRAYCQYPICNPSRTSFLTGLRPETTQVFSNDLYFRDKLPDVVTLPELFKKNGYRTVSIDKVFHAGGKLAGHDDRERSWSEVYDFNTLPAGTKGEGRSLTFPGGNKGWCRWMAAEGTDDDQPDGQAAAEAVRILNNPGDKPLFLAVGFHKPHDPFIAPKKYFDLYPKDKITWSTVPASASPEVPLAKAKGLDFSQFTDDDRREFKRAYLAGTSFTDAQIGRVLDALDKNGLREKTIVVFFGDHGYHLGEHNWWNKGTLFEHSARVPLIVSIPVGIKGSPPPRGVARGIVELIDIYPTLCYLCLLPLPDGLEGLHFLKLFDNPDGPGKKAAYTVSTRGGSMGRTVVTDRWRYTKWGDGENEQELYDQRVDPDDYVNLVKDPQYAEAVAEMQSLLDKR